MHATYNFEVDTSEYGYNRRILNKGFKCLQGWSPADADGNGDINGLNPDGVNPDTACLYRDEPQWYNAYQDRNSTNIEMLLDSAGKPLLDCEAPQFLGPFYPYAQANFFNLAPSFPINLW